MRHLIILIAIMLFAFVNIGYGMSYIILADVDADQTVYTVPISSGYQCFVATAINSGPETKNESAYSNKVCATLEGNKTTTLSWTAPTKNIDESELTDLAGFRVYIRDWSVVPKTYKLILTVGE